MQPDGFILDQVFFLGGGRSEPIELLENFTVVYRMLMPEDLMASEEAAGTYQTLAARGRETQLQRLARCIVSINRMPLIPDSKDRNTLESQLNRVADSTEQAVFLLKSYFPDEVLDLLDQGYIDWYQSEIVEKLEELKKKVPTTLDGSSSSP